MNDKFEPVKGDVMQGNKLQQEIALCLRSQ